MAARAGNLAVLNFIPLLLAGRLDLAADLLGIPIRSYIRVHGTFGLMACVQAVVHVIISVRERGWSPDQLLQLYGLIAISAFALSVILIFIRRFVYEVFIKSHYLLAVLALFAIWRHVRFQRNFAQLYMLVGSGLLITTTTLHWIILIIRNITLDRFGSRAMVSRGRDSQVAQVVIPINRPFTVHAGMTVRIWMPGVSLFSWLYSHPFTISWWETDKEGKATSITLLIQKKHGFTKSLIDHPGKEFITWVDGPYGTSYNMAQYDNVLMVASGVGIIAQIPYIRQLLDFQPKNIFVAWEVTDESNLNWVYQWMDQLLARDTGSYILRFGLYMPCSSDTAGIGQPWNSKHDRIWKLSGDIDPWKVVSTEFWRQDGSALVTVSANKRIRKALRDVIQRKMEHVVDIIELPYQPDEFQSQRHRKRQSEERV
ncbi:hypothetical protein AFLA_011866 [Aspergillus flavus NRRL3357]|nr:hypothetical protein AFLA_011866 [Aspergillus flavus NRRL3357]